MTRSLTAGVIAELATNKLNPVELIYLGISTGTYYTDHYKNLTFDGNTYTASSLFLGSSEVQENADVAVNTLSLKFSGADTTIISLLLNNNYMNKPVKVYRGFLNDSQELIADPFLLFDGRISSFTLEEDTTSSSVNIIVASHWADFEKTSGRRTAENSQKIYFPNDKGMEFASKTAQRIKWGSA
jgi:hypothetical protein